MFPNTLIKTGQPFSKALIQGQLKLLVTTKELRYCTSSASLDCKRNCLKEENKSRLC